MFEDKEVRQELDELRKIVTKLEKKLDEQRKSYERFKDNVGEFETKMYQSGVLKMDLLYQIDGVHPFIDIKQHDEIIQAMLDYLGLEYIEAKERFIREKQVTKQEEDGG